MNKEELIESICRWSLNAGHEVEQFFNSNVVIPRGENRHPYADVLHEWIEDTTKILEYKQSPLDQCFSRGYIHDAEYRIKPSEPELEYQYVLFNEDDIEIARSKFMTEQEYHVSCLRSDWELDITTKRVRK